MPTITTEPVRGNLSLPRLRKFTPLARITSVSAPPNPHSTRWGRGHDNQASCQGANPHFGWPLSRTSGDKALRAPFPSALTSPLQTVFNESRRVTRRRLPELASWKLTSERAVGRGPEFAKSRVAARIRGHHVHIHVAEYISRLFPKFLT